MKIFEDGLLVGIDSDQWVKHAWKAGKVWSGGKVALDPAAAKPTTREAAATRPASPQAIGKLRRPPLRQKGRPQ